MIEKEITHERYKEVLFAIGRKQIMHKLKILRGATKCMECA